MAATIIDAAQWNPSVNYASYDELPSGCHNSSVDQQNDGSIYDLILNKPYVTSIANGTSSGNLTISGIIYHEATAEDGFQDLLQSYGIFMAGRIAMMATAWTSQNHGICATFTFATQTTLDQGDLNLEWIANNMSSDTPHVLVTSASFSFAGRGTRPVGPSTSDPVTTTTGDSGSSSASATTSSAATSSATPSSGTESSSAANSSSHPSKNLAVLLPAILVPILVLLLTGVAVVLFLRRRRRRMAPSAAFREDHPHVEAEMHQTQSTANLLVPSGSLPRSASPYFPLDGKRPLLES